MAGSLVFTVVVVWHEVSQSVIVWIGLNVLVLVIKVRLNPFER